MASDSAATYGDGSGAHTIGQQSTLKVRQLGDGGLYSFTGSVGAGQIAAECLERAFKAGQFKAGAKVVALQGVPPNQKSFDMEMSQPLHLAHKVFQTVYNAVRPMIDAARASGSNLGECTCRSLVALPFSKQAHLFQLNEAGVPEMATPHLPFVALGSGQRNADPFLAFLNRVVWAGRQPTRADARFAAAWTILHVVKVDPGGVGGELQIGELYFGSDGKPVAELLAPETIEQHKQNVAEVEEAIQRRATGMPLPGADVPPLPTPPEPPQGQG